MFSYVNGNTIQDIQAQQLLTRIDEQLERWNKKYGSITQPTRPETFVSREAWNSSNVNSATTLYGESTHTTNNTNNTPTATTTAAAAAAVESISVPNNEEKLTSSVLLTRIDGLEKQLRAAEEDRVNLRQLLSATERRLSEVLTAQKTLQNEWISFREEFLTFYRRNNEDNTTISTTASNIESDRYHGTHFVQRQNNNNNNNNNNSNNSSSTFSGPPTVTSTELANTQGVSSSISFLRNEGTPGGMPLRNASALGIEPAQQRRMVLEQLAHRLSIPFGS
ncbi:uncharacterized protein TM35_000072830 [Trypanosoma theileri]|uniref:Uncharacterized protein n=1 Tax=Trypanosoma theileri TaxID=67003 RepID=A0A1X0P2S6_9TRYP|nr:uncharacterized protein TM35_000072830 [Trypanosoma theileri]ORC90859.1 hypothetical protein TM35_000072830 [Trypanosoma theileri]